MDLATEAAKFGPYAFVLIVVLAGVFSLWKLEAARNDNILERTLEVVENNTKALTVLCGSSAQTNTTLEAHDERAQRIENTVGQIARVVDRTEQKIDALHPAQGKARQ